MCSHACVAPGGTLQSELGISLTVVPALGISAGFGQGLPASRISI